MGCTTEGSRFDSQQRHVSLLQNIQTGSGAHLVCFSVDIVVCFPGVMQPGCEAEHSYPAASGVNDDLSYIRSFTCLRDVYRENFTSTLLFCIRVYFQFSC
jgi:hypothetical protein